MKTRNAEFLLAAVIVARSTSLLFSKIGLNTLSPLNFLALRFGLAFAVLALFFVRHLRQVTQREVLCGMVLGGAFFAVMASEMFALKNTDASTTSFLENTAIVIVPLLDAFILRRRPQRKVMTAAVVSLTGVSLLTLHGGMHIENGELLCLFTAMLYAIAISLTARLSVKGDAFLMGILQVGFLGLFSLIAACFFETPRLPRSHTEWLVILLLALVCSCFGFTFQPVAQKHLPADRAAQFCALNPLSTAILSTLFLHEDMGVYGLTGAALILGGILLQNSNGLPRMPHRNNSRSASR